MRANFAHLVVAAVLAAVAGLRAAAGDGEAEYQGKTVKEWTAALKSSDPRLRLWGAVALAEAGLEAAPAAPNLAALLKDRYPMVRRAAAQTLAGLAGEAAPAAGALVGALRDPDPVGRHWAMEGLTGLSKEAVGPLTEALKEREPQVRAAAVATLGALGLQGPKVVGALAEALKDPSAL